MKHAIYENMNRFNKVVSNLQSIAKDYGDVSLFVTGPDDPYKDGIACIMLPEAVRITKPVMHALYTACFAADVCEMTSSIQHRISFIVRDIYDDGAEIPSSSAF